MVVERKGLIQFGGQDTVVVGADFGLKYGCLIKEQRLLRRAVFVIDPSDKVVYRDYMAVLGDEPKDDEVFEAAKTALI